MKKTIIAFIALLTLANVYCQTVKQSFISSDLDNFWLAYNKMTSTKDTVLQYDYLNKLYIQRGSEGLKNIMEARRYTPKMYVDAINQYPLFWQSIRPNIEQSKKLEKDIEIAIHKLQSAYPELKPVPIYFTVGAFRTNGTTKNNSVLIGTEMAFADTHTKFSELPEYLHAFYTHFQNSYQTVDLLCTHEYVHTQQKEMVDNLLTYCLYEGVAEFVSTKVLGKPSNAPAIEFGKQNEEKVKRKFEQDMFLGSKVYNWIWGENKNELVVRDLGYYIGYTICERNYENAKDKKAAIKEMIELDYTNEAQIENFVDRAKFFSAPLKTLEENYEKSKIPIVGDE